MQYLLLIYSNESKDAAQQQKLDQAGREAYMGRWFTYTQEMKAAKVFVAGDPLQPTSTATSVRLRNGQRTATEGPFAVTGEQLGGYYLIQVKNHDEALEWAAKCPGAQHGTIELRPIMVFA